jgi:carbamoyl-phosphate synthase large subunit
MIVGAGPIVIGQACEFDYSGAQACKSLRAAGHEVVLVNSNPATIMTDPQLADRTYIEPLTVDYLEEIIRVERPDTLLPTMGGQTALNVCLELAELGILERWGVEMVGARREAIETAEDRQLFREAMDEVGLSSPMSRLVTTVDEAVDASSYTGFPAIIRPSFTLGGSGGGIAEDLEELKSIVAHGLKLSPVTSVLIEESLLGWKEYELEVVRDRADNGIIVCSIENIDPMGVHTGDSITVAPSLTLTDKEYQRLRNQSITCLRRVGVDTGGSNVQFAVNPEDGRAVVIEMNPRVSRSSALASKATGFPIAKVASLLAVGHTLDELDNEITRVTPASFEPSIDYVVVKIPRFTFEKFSDDVPLLNTSMKSVGEVMAMGRSFIEALHKALRGLEVGYCGLDEQPFPATRADQLSLLSERVPYRLLLVAQGLREGLTVDELATSTGIDPWYIRELAHVTQVESDLRERAESYILNDATGSSLESLSANQLLSYKRLGLADRRIAQLLGDVTEEEVRARRWKLGVHPLYRRVDTCAAEFQSYTQYLYSSYELAHDAVAQVNVGSEVQVSSELNDGCEANPSERKKVMILGGGPNRIGQGIEFDYCCVHAAYAIRDAGYESIMVNCNPETVSTDYDTADRLYFEPLTAEDVIEIARVEASRGELLGVIVQLGGQTPLNLTAALEAANIPILGTPRDVIDRAEDRARFQALIEGLSLRQPMSAVAYDVEEATEIAARVEYPVLLRPSYVLGGRAMRLVNDEVGLRAYIGEAQAASLGGGVLIDQYLVDAIEVDVDALCDGDDVWVVGVMEHIEEAGVHSGDSACSLPPYSLSAEIIAKIERQTTSIALELGVIGLMNIQFAVSKEDVYLIEVNPRASRTVPFVAKTRDIPVARIATQLMLGMKLSELERPSPRQGFIAVKEAVFPFARFPNADLLLGPEMLSTGEVMGWDQSFELAYAKAQIAAGMHLPKSGRILFAIGKEKQRLEFAPLARRAAALGYEVHATEETQRAWDTLDAGQFSASCTESDAVQMLHDGMIQLLISVDTRQGSTEESTRVRRAGLAAGVPYFTRLTNTRALLGALEALASQGQPSVHALQDSSFLKSSS